MASAHAMSLAVSGKPEEVGSVNSSKLGGHGPAVNE
jgi:hypothetical protein